MNYSRRHLNPKTSKNDSFHYAAYAGLLAFTQGRPDDFAGLERWAESWRQWVSAAFLQTYRDTAAAAPFLAGRAVCEQFYELNNRPDWVRIPLRGVLALAGAAGGRAAEGGVP